MLIFVHAAGTNLYAQESINNSGGNSQNSQVGLAFSVGQVFADFESSSNGNITVGIQQSYITAVPSIVLSPIPTSFCRGDQFSIGFIANGLGVNNLLQIQLSDENGSFSNISFLGTFSIRNTGQVNVSIPTHLPAGIGYRIRILVTSPNMYSNLSDPISIGLSGCNNISTQLQAADCGRTNFLLGGPAGIANNVIFAANGVSGVLHYRFICYDASGQNLLGTIETPSRFFIPANYLWFVAGNTYQIYVEIENEKGWGTAGSPCTIGFRTTPSPAEVPQVNISSQACASQAYSLSSWGRASGVNFINAVRNASLTNYEFEISNGSQILTTVFVPSANLYLRDYTHIFSQGNSYSIKVRGYMGPTPGNWSPTCQIAIPPVMPPNTQIRPDICGTKSLTLAQNNGGTDVSGIHFIVVERVAGAIYYEFEVLDEFFSQYRGSAYADSKGRLHPRDYQHIFQWGETYQIRVRALTDFSAGNWGNYCQISILPNPALSNIPDTKLRQCNQTLTSSNIRANDVAGATQFRFEFFTDAAATQLFAIATSNVNLNIANVNPPLTPNTNYFVLVSARVNGQWGTPSVSNLCRITTPNALPRMPNIAANNNFQITGFPNPFHASATLVIKSSNDTQVQLTIADITGRIISNQSIQTNLPFEFGEHIASGAYLIIAEDKNGNKAYFKSIKN